jgi:hypothetical protein
MTNKLKDKRINGAALEQIMQDVLQGMARFTEDSCQDSCTRNLEIHSVLQDYRNDLSMKNVIPFERPKKSA